VGDDERQRVLVRRPHVEEVDIEAVDLGDEPRQRVQPGLEPPQVGVGAPVAHEFLHRRQLHALRLIGDGLLLGPARRLHAPAQLGEVLLGDANVEGADGGVLGCCGWRGGTRAGRGALRHAASPQSVHAARQVSFAPAGVRIRQWPARLASRDPEVPDRDAGSCAIMASRGGQLLARVDGALPGGPAGGLQLAPGPLGERLDAHRLQQGVGGPQLRPAPRGGAAGGTATRRRAGARASCTRPRGARSRRGHRTNADESRLCRGPENLSDNYLLI
jgi:hypothetical protein